MTKDELFEVIDYNTTTLSHNRAIKTAVEAYSSASNDAKPHVSGSLPPSQIEKLNELISDFKFKAANSGNEQVQLMCNEAWQNLQGLLAAMTV